MFLFRRTSMILTGLILLVGSAVAAEGLEPSASQLTISKTQLVERLKADGVGVAEDDVELPNALVSSAEQPELQIKSVQKMGSGRADLLVRCSQASECLPFNAVVRLSDSDIAKLQEHIRAQVSTVRGAESTRLGVPEGIMLRVGSHVTLLLVGSHTEIRLPAVAVDAGQTGADVRVKVVDKNLMFHGTVLDASTVRGDVP